jgi:filamentous hemagglutinin family protein
MLCAPLGTAHAAGTLPGGGRFVAGAGSISTSGTTLSVNQTSQRGVIDWNSFSIGSGNRVYIDNGAGATLNRVTGGSPTLILGSLGATGSVYLINPQGIVIGSAGTVSTGGRFLASTLDTPDTAFMQGGPLTFAGASGATLVNMGSIGSTGGDVVLLARLAAVNAGNINAPQGTAELAVGRSILLQDSSSSRQVFVQQGSAGTVTNWGRIAAAQVSLQAADGNVFALAGRHDAIRATGTAARDGHVWLVADGGRVMLAGSVAATNTGGSGGTLDTAAQTFAVCDCAAPSVTAGIWRITTPALVVGRSIAGALARSLTGGTSVELDATGANGKSGDLELATDVRWSGGATLTLAAYRNVSIGAGATVANVGTGNLVLRADATAIDNGGGVTNGGTIDWSSRRGTLRAYYDMNGSYTAGTLRLNPTWQAALAADAAGQQTNYRLVNSLSDLQNISLNLAGNYALGRDIAGNGASINALGDNTTPFSGQFDGMGHTIDRIVVPAPGTWNGPFGLFGVIGATGVVRDVGVTNGSAPYDYSGIYGILAGINRGKIVDAYTTGSLQGYGYDTYDATTGGLVGQNEGTILRSWSSASNSGQGLAGGLVGRNVGTVSQSYASGDLIGGQHLLPGGLVGDNQGTVSQSYATGAVTGVFGAGGLAFENEGTIAQSFATGAVQTMPGSADYAGAIAGINSGTIATDVYWNAQTTGMANAVGTGAGLPASNGLSTAQMSKRVSFAGWDFGADGAWVMPAGATHPVLRWQQGD